MKEIPRLRGILEHPMFLRNWGLILCLLALLIVPVNEMLTVAVLLLVPVLFYEVFIRVILMLAIVVYEKIGLIKPKVGKHEQEDY